MLLGQLDLDKPFALSADSVLSPYVFVFYASFIVAFLFTPIMRSIAMHYDIVDHPDGARKMHRMPVAYLGGVAVFLGWLIGLAISQVVQLHYWEPGLPTRVDILLPVVFGAVLIVVLGLLDDIRKGGISPMFKILGQITAAFALLLAGVGDTLTEPFFRNLNARLFLHFDYGFTPDILALMVKFSSGALTVGIVVFCCNATNLMDGLDGLCGGVTSIIALGYVAVMVYLGMHSGVEDSNLAGLRVVLALALLGAVLGFVPYNFNPASIFMGDAGSMFLGFACALAIIMAGEMEAKWLLATMVMFALPVLDTALAFARRYVNRRPLFSADKQHIHHQLVGRGLSVKQAVLVAYALAIFFVLCGLAIVFMRTRYAAAFYLVLFGCIVVAAYKMGMVHERPATVKRSGVGDNDRAITPAEPGTGVIDVQPRRRSTDRPPA